MAELNRDFPIYGIAFDGVIAATDELASQWLKNKRGLTVPSHMIAGEYLIRLIGKDSYDRMSAEVYGDSTPQAEPIHWVAGTLLSLSLNNNLYVVTTRPPERKRAAGIWLAEYDLLDLFVDLLGTKDHDIPNDTKLAICQRYGMKAMVDNDPRHLVGEVHDDFTKVLLKEGSTEDIETSDGVILARNWDEVLVALE